MPVSRCSRRLFGGLIAAAVVAAPLLAVPGPAAADTLDDIQKAGTVRIAVPQDYAPFGSVGPDMHPVGYDIDMAGVVAKGLGVKLDLVAVTSGNRLPFLQTGKVDLIISSLGRNPERDKVIDFSAAYAPYYSGVFGPASIKVTGPQDLSGKTIAATGGALEDLELSKIAPPDAVIQRFEDNNATITAFLSGQVDLIATGNVAAAAIIARNPPNRPESKFVIKNSPCYIGLAKDQPRLLARVNDIIAAARHDGTLEAMSQHWLGVPLTGLPD